MTPVALLAFAMTLILLVVGAVRRYGRRQYTEGFIAGTVGAYEKGLEQGKVQTVLMFSGTSPAVARQIAPQYVDQVIAAREGRQ